MEKQTGRKRENLISTEYCVTFRQIDTQSMETQTSKLSFSSRIESCRNNIEIKHFIHFHQEGRKHTQIHVPKCCVNLYISNQKKSNTSQKTNPIGLFPILFAQHSTHFLLVLLTSFPSFTIGNTKNLFIEVFAFAFCLVRRCIVVKGTQRNDSPVQEWHETNAPA